MAKVDAGSFLAIVLAAAVAAAIVTALPRRYSPSVVVVELVLGISACDDRDRPSG